MTFRPRPAAGAPPSAPAAGAPAAGKIPPEWFARWVAPRLGASHPDVLVGPRAGHDCALVRVAPGRVMAITTDPISLVPALGPENSARLSCHLLASDAWTSGIAPQFAAVDLNLPPAMDDGTLARYWEAMSAEWAALGVAVVAGHTGRYPGCDYSIIGAATLMGTGDEAAYLTPAMAAPGDRLIVTKGCALEAAAIAAWLFPGRLSRHLDADSLARARALVDQVSVVRDCRTLLGIGVRSRGVTALHDATEGGVFGGLLELAGACGCTVRVRRADVPLSAEARAACAAFGDLDPYWTLAEGALIAAVRPERLEAALEALRAAAIPAAAVGAVTKGAARLEAEEPDGRLRVWEQPLPDPYWDAYDRAVRERWS